MRAAVVTAPPAQLRAWRDRFDESADKTTRSTFDLYAAERTPHRIPHKPSATTPQTKR
jgi:hypothetical protein